MNAEQMQVHMRSADCAPGYDGTHTIDLKCNYYKTYYKINAIQFKNLAQIQQISTGHKCRTSMHVVFCRARVAMTMN